MSGEGTDLTKVWQKGWGKLLFLMALVLAGAASARLLGLQDLLRLENLARLKAWIDGFGPFAPLVFIVGYILAELLFVPGLPITVLGGVAFGPIWGTVYVSIASTIGASLCFLIARHGAREMVERWVRGDPRFQRIDQASAEHAWRIIMITRLVPLIPFNLQNYAYGLTKVRFLTYALTSWLCMLPGTAAYTFAGGALSEGGGDIRRTLAYLGIAGALLVLISLIPRQLQRRSRVADVLLKSE
ncbi:MAG: TVP38/TMEM64 family protein [Candidatus Methylomirabilales bacterium]